jgi:hypothetical protein
VTTVISRFLVCAALLFVGVIMSPRSARGDACITDAEWINTNRPVQTTSAGVVPESSLQIENGMIWSVGQGSNTLDAPETFLRFGIYHCLELEFYTPNYFYSVNGPSGSGFADSAIASEYQFGTLPDRYQLAVVSGLGMPTGSKELASHGWNPYFQLPWQVSINEAWSAAGMLSFTWYTGNSSQNPTIEPTVVLQRSFCGPNGTAAIEYAGMYTHQQPSQILDGYFEWRPTMHQQIDFEGGFGLNRNSPDHFLGFGYSFRLDHIFNRLMRHLN